MSWSPIQQEALDAIEEWLRDGHPQVFRLFGYAGTGKSTLARHFGDMANRSVQFCAFTGKASIVMRRKGCLNARTIHSVIYEPHNKSKDRLNDLKEELEKAKAARRPTHKIESEILDERRALSQPGFHLRPRDQITDNIDLFIIDEVSMVNEQMGRDLLSFGLPILVLGDPAQLPPVRGAGFFTEAKPDIMLTEIHRQAADNPIIALASHIREGGEPYDVLSRSDVKKDEWLAADQILVGTHRVRHYVNSRMRDWLGFSGTYPQIGEKIICLRNNWDLGLLNGSIWKVEKVVFAENRDTFEVGISSMDEGEEARYLECYVHKAIFEGRELLEMDERNRANEFDFAYSITTHKAQGSQWDDVIYIDDWPGRATKKEHRYTGITRAAETIKVVRW